MKHCPCRFWGEPLTCRLKLFSFTADLWKQHLFQGLLGIWNEAMWLWFWGVVGLTRRLTQVCKKYRFLSIQKPAWGSDAKRPDSTKLANTFILVILASFYSTSLWRHIERGAGAHFSVISICLWSSVPTQVLPQTPLQTHRHTRPNWSICYSLLNSPSTCSSILLLIHARMGLGDLGGVP